MMAPSQVPQLSQEKSLSLDSELLFLPTGKTKKKRILSAHDEEPQKKIRKTSMTKKRRMALEAATAAAIARGEKPPTLEDIKEDLSPRKPKKPKKEKKSQAKPKDPVDVEKQCGVPLPNGLLCARSLTCKTHSMSAKRSVQGRSAPYDVLLGNYQKKNQIKLASLSNSQQLADENEAFGGANQDPEEEVQQVMTGVLRSNPVPLEQKVLFPMKLRTQFVKMREMLAGALVPPNYTSTPIQQQLTGSIFGRMIGFNKKSLQADNNFKVIQPINLARVQQLQAMKMHQQRMQQQQQQQLQQQQQQQHQTQHLQTSQSSQTLEQPQTPKNK